MHQSIETTAPLVRESTVIAGEMCFYLPDGPAVRSDCGGFVFAPKIAGIWVYTRVRRHWWGIYQPLVPAGLGFYLGLARPKVHPRYSPDHGGQWLQLTGAL